MRPVRNLPDRIRLPSSISRIRPRRVPGRKQAPGTGYREGWQERCGFRSFSRAPPFRLTGRPPRPLPVRQTPLHGLGQPTWVALFNTSCSKRPGRSSTANVWLGSGSTPAAAASICPASFQTSVSGARMENGSVSATARQASRASLTVSDGSGSEASAEVEQGCKRVASFGQLAPATRSARSGPGAAKVHGPEVFACVERNRRCSWSVLEVGRKLELDHRCADLPVSDPAPDCGILRSEAGVTECLVESCSVYRPTGDLKVDLYVDIDRAGVLELASATKQLRDQPPATTNSGLSP